LACDSRFFGGARDVLIMLVVSRLLAVPTGPTVPSRIKDL
jgi:hypothetical protein